MSARSSRGRSRPCQPASQHARSSNRPRDPGGLVSRAWRARAAAIASADGCRSEEHTSELQSLMRISYAVFCLKKKNKYMISNIQDSQTSLHSKSTARTYRNDTTRHIYHL